MAEEQKQVQVQKQKQEQEDNFDTFPCNSFLEESIINYNDEDYEESDSKIAAEMAEIQITEIETEISNISFKELGNVLYISSLHTASVIKDSVVKIISELNIAN
ncbi:hypothetical protein C1646_766688 [Rhizophagus diaphanus]|nr:hypothetical protein C1646_766688 [Rhizophagus diaphanus] [Rhizophagus sp. MUCL 43196]